MESKTTTIFKENPKVQAVQSETSDKEKDVEKKEPKFQSQEKQARVLVLGDRYQEMRLVLD